MQITTSQKQYRETLKYHRHHRYKQLKHVQDFINQVFQFLNSNSHTIYLSKESKPNEYLQIIHNFIQWGMNFIYIPFERENSRQNSSIRDLVLRNNFKFQEDKISVFSQWIKGLKILIHKLQSFNVQRDFTQWKENSCSQMFRGFWESRVFEKRGALLMAESFRQENLEQSGVRLIILSQPHSLNHQLNQLMAKR